MIKAIFFGIILLFAATSKLTANITAKNFQQEILDYPGDLLLEVSSLHCGACQILAPIFSDLKQKFGDKIKFCKLDPESDLELVQKLEIYLLPTILFIRKGEIVDRQTGLIHAEALQGKIEVTFGVSLSD